MEPRTKNVLLAGVAVALLAVAALVTIRSFSAPEPPPPPPPDPVAANTQVTPDDLPPERHGLPARSFEKPKQAPPRRTSPDEDER